MATVVDVEPVDIHRESLLDTRTEAKLSAGKTGSVARVALVAKYSCEPEALTEAAEAYFAGAADEKHTGAFLYFSGSSYSQVVYVILEASSVALEAFVAGSVAGMLEGCRVVGWSDDLGARAWPLFTTATLQSSTTSGDLMDAGELAGALPATLLGGAKLGRSLCDLAEDEVAAKITAGTDFHPAPTFMLSALATPPLFTLEKYLAMMIAPAKLDLASEKVWPTQELRLTY